MTKFDLFCDFVESHMTIFYVFFALCIIVGTCGLVWDVWGERILLWGERHKLLTIERDDTVLVEDER